MSREVVRLLKCKPGGLYVDGTIGGGGHAEEILRATGLTGKVIGIDWDEEALLASRERLKGYRSRVTLVHDNFANIKKILTGLHITSVDGILLDLGVSSHHLERPERGFSFRFDTPLDMRMDRRQKKTAYHLVNGLSEGELEQVLWRYGEERWARQIARAIVRARKDHTITTTKELADLVSSAIPSRFHPRDIHPATRTFQALRIAVNGELENLKRAIEDGVKVLSREGRMGIISFHSLEDR
ncbi:MAG: 16S rRNA (cytosine(1402)-N(4))-methyltransferase RsmH, partial [Deltaproteobacteria bacterium]|nr:16S rRNA (cytosine(1402)-N(4))-methyltransferase RsmH [Deltaproteobacteria bacterium]